MRLFGKKQETPPPKPKKRRKKRLPKAMRRDEMSAVLAYNAGIYEEPIGPLWRKHQAIRDQAILLCMYHAGLRVGETCNLNLEDVELDEGIIRVWDGKGGDGTAYAKADVIEAIRAWLEIRGDYVRTPGEKRLFVAVRSPSGGPVTVRYVQRMVKRVAEKAGVDPNKITPHRLRHSFATELLEDVGDLRIVQTAVRHANIGTTEIYTHLRDDRVKQAVQGTKGGEEK